MTDDDDLQQKNAAGRDALAEAIFAGEGKEEVAGWIEGFLWRVEGGDDGDKDVDNAKRTEIVGQKEDKAKISIEKEPQAGKGEHQLSDELIQDTAKIRLDRD